jgi:hypothetical protein
MLGRVQLLLLAFALVNAAGALVVVVDSNPQPPILYLLGLASVPALALVWTTAYRRRVYESLGDIVTIAAICLITMAVAERWFYEVVALLTAAVFFGSSFGSLPRVLFRTALYSAVVVGEGISDPTALTMAVVFTVAFVVVAFLMHGMASSMTRYEQTARREHILAATGLDLVAACDLRAIVDSAVEGARALCADLPAVRVSLAISEGTDSPATQFRVMGSAGQRSADVDGAIIDVRRLVAAGHELADQRLFSGGVGATLGEQEPPAGEAGFLLGEILATRITVAGSARGVLLIESPTPISDELPCATRALATQISLAIGRMDLQTAAATRESTERFQAWRSRKASS